MLNILFLQNVPIYTQLKIEEALLRCDARNWCIINQGSSPAIVLGISADPEKVIDRSHFLKNPIPIIRRYSGGGTVVVEPETLFLTWIWNHENVPISPFPKEVLHWTGSLLKSLLHPLPIDVMENDYVLGNLKCGGNAQYFIKNRFVHHTSLLWDYSPHFMNYLLMPPKMPSYRNSRSHEEFLCTLKPHFKDSEEIIQLLVTRLKNTYPVNHITQEEVEKITKLPHRSSTQFVSFFN